MKLEEMTCAMCPFLRDLGSGLAECRRYPKERERGGWESACGELLVWRQQEAILTELQLMNRKEA